MGILAGSNALVFSRIEQKPVRLHKLKLNAGLLWMNVLSFGTIVKAKSSGSGDVNQGTLCNKQEKFCRIGLLELLIIEYFGWQKLAFFRNKYTWNTVTWRTFGYAIQKYWNLDHFKKCCKHGIAISPAWFFLFIYLVCFCVWSKYFSKHIPIATILRMSKTNYTHFGLFSGGAYTRAFAAPLGWKET